MRNLFLTTVAVIAATQLLPASMDTAGTTENPPDTPLVLTIYKNSQMLQIRGIASSTAHEVILRRTAQRYFGNATIVMDLDSGIAAPPGWALVTELVLRAVAQTDAARASITASHVSIEGVSTRPGDYAAALRRIESALLDNMSVRSNVSGIDANRSFDELCQARFRVTGKSGTIGFAVSATDFSPNALALLDALVEIAVDCPETRIRVSGHTDGRGDAAANQTLGRARALSVIDYMTGRGVPAKQFEDAVAVGPASDHVSSNAVSRQMSRRVELEMIVP